MPGLRLGTSVTASVSIRLVSRVLVGILLACIGGFGAGDDGTVEQNPVIQGCPSSGPSLLERGGQRILSSRDLERRTISCVSPKFPGLARQMRLEGQVHIAILVDESGQVVCAHVVSGHPIMIGSAIDAARQWKFRPAVQHGRRVAFYGILAFHYSTSGNVKKRGSCLEAHW